MESTFNLSDPKASAAVQHAIRLAFQRAKTKPADWRKQRRTGRVDARRAWTLEAQNNLGIFKQRRIPGATKVNVHILVDASSSMSSAISRDSHVSRMRAAATLTGVLTDALGRNPLVRLSVWAHNTGGAADLQVVSVIRDGKGRDKVARMGNMAAGANGDGYVLRWMGDFIKKHRRPQEVDLIIIVSDGMPSWRASRALVGLNAQQNMDREMELRAANNGMSEQARNVRDTVNNLRMENINVLSVGITHEGDKMQAPMYGREHVVMFDGDWNRLAVDFGTAFGRVLGDETDKAMRGTTR
jgi:hypothetical protein